MTLTPKLTLNLRVGQLQQEVQLASAASLQQVFSQEIEPEAKRLSPVSAENPSIPASRGEKRIDTGHNRRSIDSDVELTADGPKASLFTQSGYGGYLETGTSKMPARPYLWPAAQKFFSRISTVMRDKLKAA